MNCDLKIKNKNNTLLYILTHTYTTNTEQSKSPHRIPVYCQQYTCTYFQRQFLCVSHVTSIYIFVLAYNLLKAWVWHQDKIYFNEIQNATIKASRNLNITLWSRSTFAGWSMCWENYSTLKSDCSCCVCGYVVFDSQYVFIPNDIHYIGAF